MGLWPICKVARGIKPKGLWGRHHADIITLVTRPSMHWWFSTSICFALSVSGLDINSNDISSSLMQCPTIFQVSTASSVLVAILSFLSIAGKHQAFMFDPDSFFICTHFLRDLMWPRGIQCHLYAKNMRIYLAIPLLLSELQTCRSEPLVLSSPVALEPGRAQVDTLVSPAP